MTDKEDKVLKIVKHYQSSIERHLNDENRLLHCVKKLDTLPVQVVHLQETGVGRTLNALRKMPNEVGPAAIALVNKWKLMVIEDEEQRQNSQETTTTTTTTTTTAAAAAEAHSSSNDENEQQNSAATINSTQAKDDDDDDNVVAAALKQVTTSPPKENNHYAKEENSSCRKRSRSPSASASSAQPQQNKKHSSNNGLSKRRSSSQNRHETRKHQSRHRERKECNEESNALDNTKQHSAKRRKHEDKDSKDKDSSSSKTHMNSTSTSTSSATLLEANNLMPPDVSSSSSPSKLKSKDKANGDNSPFKNKTSKCAGSSSSSSGGGGSGGNGGGGDIKRSEKSFKEKSSPSKKSKCKSDHDIKNEHGIDSAQGANFADVLAMIDVQRPTQKLKKSNKKSPTYTYKSPKGSKEEDATTKMLSALAAPPKLLLPLNMQLEQSSEQIISDEVVPSFDKYYKPGKMTPLLQLITGNAATKYNKKPETDSNRQRDSDLIVQGITSKSSRTKIYSGNIKEQQAISLYETCWRYILRNFDAMEYTGGVPYEVLRPILERVSYQQLFAFEAHNPYIIEDTDELWKNHVHKIHRGAKRHGNETWRDMFLRAADEKEEKLNSITASIKRQQKMKEAPVRKTKLAFLDTMVKPPLNVQRKQATFGTQNKLTATPAARIASLSAITPNAAPVGGHTAYTPSSAIRPEKPHLMKKTLSMMRKFRR